MFFVSRCILIIRFLQSFTLIALSVAKHAVIQSLHHVKMSDTMVSARDVLASNGSAGCMKKHAAAAAYSISTNDQAGTCIHTG